MRHPQLGHRLIGVARIVPGQGLPTGVSEDVVADARPEKGVMDYRNGSAATILAVETLTRYLPKGSFEPGEQATGMAEDASLKFQRH